MEIRYILEDLEFYLLPSLLVALIPTTIIVLITFTMKSLSNWKLIFLCLFAGLFMWCDLTYWSIQGFLIFPFGIDFPLFTHLFAIIGGVIGGIVVYRGTIGYRKSKSLAAIFAIGIGYFVFVFVAFSILQNRWVA